MYSLSLNVTLRYPKQRRTAIKHKMRSQVLSHLLPREQLNSKKPYPLIMRIQNLGVGSKIMDQSLINLIAPIIIYLMLNNFLFVNNNNTCNSVKIILVINLLIQQSINIIIYLHYI